LTIEGGVFDANNLGGGRRHAERERLRSLTLSRVIVGNRTRGARATGHSAQPTQKAGRLDPFARSGG
jgi:hypothetical protein